MESQPPSDSHKQESVAAPANWARWPRRVVVYATGTAIVVAGIVILPLPGPMGTPIILIGLTVLARESPRAERIRARMVEALRLKQLAEARPKRFRLHLSTVIALTVTAGALVGVNAMPRPVGYNITVPTTGQLPDDAIAGTVRGWPLNAFKEYYPSPYPGSASNLLGPSRWDFTHLIANLLVALVILGSTLFFVEGFASRKDGLFIRLHTSTMVILLLIYGILLWANLRIYLGQDYPYFRSSSGLVWRAVDREKKWKFDVRGWPFIHSQIRRNSPVNLEFVSPWFVMLNALTGVLILFCVGAFMEAIRNQRHGGLSGLGRSIQ